MNHTEQKKKSRKSIIFEEAAQLFKEKGYQAASMRDLAQRVQLEPSSLYSHIKSKDELLQKICFDCATRFTLAMQHISNEVISPLSKIRKLIDVHVQIALEEPSSITVFNDEWKNLPISQLKEFKQMRKEYELQFIEILEEAKQSGILIDASSEIMLNTMISGFRWIQPGTGRTDKWKAEKIKTDIANFIIGGLTNKKYQSQ